MYPRARIDALTDGVFAVAMTLLVLDVHLPDDFHPHDAGELIAALPSRRRSGSMPPTPSWSPWWRSV
jgi:Endosomal/lysosomal potassium channel TMEM175